MMKQLLATTALAAALAGATVAQEATEEPLITDPAAEQPMEEELAPLMGQGEDPAPVVEGESTTAQEAAPVTEEGATTAEEAPPPAGDEATTTAQDAPPAAEPADPLAQPPAGELPAAPVLVPVDLAEITVDDLIDAKLRNMDGENLGNIDDALLDDSGSIEALVVSFGGFLGFGKKTVEVALEEIELLKDEAGNVVAETSMTPETLEARPEYQAQPEA